MQDFGMSRILEKSEEGKVIATSKSVAFSNSKIY
jgi:hypothetical protein